MSKKKKVVVSLKDVILPVHFYPENEGVLALPIEEMERLARLAVKEHFEKNPMETIKISHAEVLTKPYLFEKEVYPGRIVRTESNELGIVLNVSSPSPHSEEKPVSVVLAGHRIHYYDHTELYETDATFAEARCLRMDFSREEELWHQGDTAYMQFKMGGSSIHHIPVIVGKTSRNVTKVHEISNDHKPSRTWEIKTINLYRFLTEFKSTAERDSYLSTDSIIECYRIIKEMTKPVKLTGKEQIVLFQHLIFNNTLPLPSVEQKINYRFYKSPLLLAAYKNVIQKMQPDLYKKVRKTVSTMVRNVPKSDYQINVAN
ncbi:hypothetical protein [Solibacillus sp. NPDC093137]|uniref:hypothetical protein n=1 Tax=Solibacillus sp. NPDC093137 TaxID=3390678 RepID=UPI003D087D1A